MSEITKTEKTTENTATGKMGSWKLGNRKFRQQKNDSVGKRAILCCPFSYHVNFRCRIFSLPNFLLLIFPLPFFSVALFPLPLFHTLILCCPVFIPSHFSLPIFPIAQFSGCRFFRCRFYLLPASHLSVWAKLIKRRSRLSAVAQHVIRLIYAPNDLICTISYRCPFVLSCSFRHRKTPTVRHFCCGAPVCSVLKQAYETEYQLAASGYRLFWFCFVDGVIKPPLLGAGVNAIDCIVCALASETGRHETRGGNSVNL